MTENDLLKRLAVLQSVESLKDTLRSGFTARGRPEDTASHTWRLCLWVLMFEDYLKGVDIAKLLKICVLHDLGEAVSGDIPATQQQGDKSAEERLDFASLLAPLNTEQSENLLSLWDEYNANQTPESRLAKGFDKLETILQHSQGLNPEDFDYGFNLTYGRAFTDAHPLLAQLRDLVDIFTKKRMR